MKKGLYAKYKGEDYKARLIENKVRLISYNATDLDKGFKEKNIQIIMTLVISLECILMKLNRMR